jgi:uncharacterized SAM-binding protein YcdF (DUF218 family)
VSDDLPLDRPSGVAPVDRSRADSLAPDYRTRGTVRVGEQFSPGRVVATVVVALLVLVGIYYVVTLAQVLHTGGSHGADDADAIIVMGAAQYDGRPSPQLAARLDHVVTLWDEGVAPLVVVTGGNIPGDRFTEAEASARYLVERGVPASAIVEVGEGSNTLESVEAAARIMDAHGIEGVALVTDPYHALRSRLIVEDAGFDVDVAATPSSVVTGWSSFERSVKEAAGVALGRIIGFDRLTSLTG